jgi:hypothetical protein
VIGATLGGARLAVERRMTPRTPGAEQEAATERVPYGASSPVCDEELLPFYERFGLVPYGAMLLRRHEALGP